MSPELQIIAKQREALGQGKHSIIPIAIAVWIAVTVFGFWTFEMRYFLPATRPAGAAQIDASVRPLSPMAGLQTSAGKLALVDSGHPVLINFWNPECPCSRFMEHHVRELLSAYRGKGVRFVTVVVSPEDGLSASDCAAKWLSRGFAPDQMPYVVDSDDSISRKFGVWAAPAAVILDSSGRVEYIGAYNVARYCDNAATAYAQMALEDVIAGRHPAVATLPFYGCQVIAQSVSPKL